MAIREGQFYQTLHYDVNHDGADEIIALSAYKVEDDSYMGQLVVTTSDNKLLFIGPKPETPRDPFAFGHYHYGNADIQAIVEDTDENGSACVSLIGAMAVSDLRPTPFRIWRWNDGMFIPEFVNTLIEEPADSNYYVWQERDFDYSTDRWISKFWREKDGELMGRIIDTTSEDRVLIGEAKLVVTDTGYGIKEWVKLPQ